ncbi:hypothetical protein VTL71DRAFT_7191 [Oculimacula yallundae]|uniref:Xylanolytic transcriptional activator regulatory domain-containing protein n=1 Tax=Oculimacula yallundae TaxID=86028 RepID=A0ABR4BVZ9_9HELO
MDQRYLSQEEEPFGSQSLQPPKLPQAQQSPQSPRLPPDQQLITSPTKRRRIDRSCDYCHEVGMRCTIVTSIARCEQCKADGMECVDTRPPPDRTIDSSFSPGIPSPPRKTARSVGEFQNTESTPLPYARLNDASTSSIRRNEIAVPLEEGETPLGVETIRQLVKLYLEIVSPIFPVIHRPSINSTIESALEHDASTKGPDYATVMAMCAITSARIKHGALFPHRSIPDLLDLPDPEAYFLAAEKALSKRIRTRKGLDLMRVCALLALYGMQVGRKDTMYKYLDVYDEMATGATFHNEERWPKCINIIEVEFRRRLFWTVYTYEVYSYIVWGRVISGRVWRESQCSVSYPSEVDDSDILSGIYSKAEEMRYTRHTDPVHWLHGWTFIVKLYRLLEHAIERYHSLRPNSIESSSSKVLSYDVSHCDETLTNVTKLYSDFEIQSPHFKNPALELQDNQEDEKYLYCFQAANILSTLQLARMVLLTCEKASVRARLDVAHDLLGIFGKVETFFLQTVSCLLLHQVETVGNILVSSMEGPIPEPECEEFGVIFLSMLELLQRLESGITSHTGAGCATERLLRLVLEKRPLMLPQHRERLVIFEAAYPATDVEKDVPVNVESKSQPVTDSVA